MATLEEVSIRVERGSCYIEGRASSFYSFVVDDIELVVLTS